MLFSEVPNKSLSNFTPAELGKTVIQVDPPYYPQQYRGSSKNELTWNQPSSSPFATLSPAFFDQPILPTNIAFCQLIHVGGISKHLPPIATKATGTASRPGPRLA
jgi:hypothetical protein